MSLGKRRKTTTQAGSLLSRRDFARRAAAATAAAAGMAAVPEALLAAPRREPPPPAQQPSGDTSKLSPEARAEAEAKVANILSRYGARLNEEQKTDVRRLIADQQKTLEALRAFPLQNSDEPATVLHLYLPAQHAAPKRPAAPRVKKGGA